MPDTYDEALRKLPAHARVTAARGRNAKIKADRLREEAHKESETTAECIKLLATKYGVSSYAIADVMGMSRTRCAQILNKFGLTPTTANAKRRQRLASRASRKS